LPLFTPKIQHKWPRIEPGLRVYFGCVTCTSVVSITLLLRVSESVSDPLSVRVFGSFLHFVTAVDLSPDGINTERIQPYPFLEFWTSPIVQTHQKHNISGPANWHYKHAIYQVLFV
jgi:hypothetical protein